MASAGARTYNGGSGAEPPAGSRGRAPGQGVRERLDSFYQRDAMLAMSVCVCLSQVGVLSKRLDGSSWCLVCRLLSTSPTLCCEEIQVTTK